MNYSLRYPVVPPPKRSKKPVVIAITVLLLVIVVSLGAIKLHQNLANNPKLTVGATNQKASKQTTTKPATGSAFDKRKYSLTDPASPWVVVNKQHPLNPATYVPADLVMPDVPLRVPGNESMQLRAETAKQLQAMFTAAGQQGLKLMLSSGYRSYTYQVSLYNGYVQSQGQSVADTQSARPGYSEHQTGMAADIEPAARTCELEQCFGDTPEGKWLATNAYTYGFIIRYTTGNDTITGYEPEPWHVRYVGTALAKEMHDKQVATLEQFFNVSGGKAYK